MSYTPPAFLRLFATACLILLIAVINGCASKFTPTNQMVNQSNSLTAEQAVKLFNDNIYLPYRITEKVIVAPGVSYTVGGYDVKTGVHATPQGIFFKNLFKKGKEKSRSEGKIYSEVDRYDMEIPYQEIQYILEAADRAAKNFCYANDHVVGFQFSQRNYFILCVKNKEQTYAAILKLFPTADLQTLQ